MLKKAAALMLALAVAFSFGGCKTEGENGSVETPIAVTTTAPVGTGTLKLAFCANDSLDPYSAQSKANRQLVSLMFDPLVKLDSELNSQMCLAQSYDTDGKVCVVTLKYAVFSDGTQVTGSDVITSLELARSMANSIYPTQLSNISSVDCSTSTVTFALKKADPNFINLLDFPIIKGGTRNRTNSDNKAIPPIGCGRYVYSYSNGSYYLRPNERYYDTVAQNSVELVNVPDTDAWKYAIRSGEADIYYSGDDVSDLPSFSGGTTQPRHTDFVFLSVSDSSELLGSKPLRNAINSFLDRRQITESAFFTYAYPAVSPYPNTVKFAEGTEQGLSPTGNSDTAADYLSEAGYSSKNEQGIYLDKNGVPLTMALIYNESEKNHKIAASLISEQLRKLGIVINLNGLDSDSYKKRIISGEYELALCEIKLNKNLDLSPVFALSESTGMTTTTVAATTTATPSNDDAPIASAAPKYNAGAVSQINSVYSEYLDGKIDLKEFMESFYKLLPIIPVCHRTGLTGYSSSILVAAESSVSDAYLNFQNISAK